MVDTQIASELEQEEDDLASGSSAPDSAQGMPCERGVDRQMYRNMVFQSMIRADEYDRNRKAAAKPR